MGIEFDEEKKFNQSFDTKRVPKKSGITNWLINLGIAKDENFAKIIMSIITIICFIVAIFFVIK